VSDTTPGSYTYSVTVIKGTCKDSGNFSFAVNVCSGIESYFDPNGFEIFPNPACNQLYMTLDNPLSQAIILTITDITGRQILKQTVGISESQFNINVSSFAPSIYFLKLQTEEGNTVRKFMKE
jgi:Secretion system C-terminal sorting domain